MQTFITGVSGAALAIIAMHFIANFFVKRDDKTRQIKYNKMNIKLNEKCALVLRLYGEQKPIQETLVNEIENLVLEMIDLNLCFDESAKMSTSEILLETLENPVCTTDIKQAFMVGRIYSSLKLLYSL